jgi:hypothetical protein
MKAQHSFTTELLIGLIVLGLGCGGTINTGTAKKPVNNKPAADGSCPSGQSLCGVGRFAICVDLQNDPNHCGTCDRTCSAGIACQASACQQTVCTGTTVPLSGQPTTITSTTGGTSTTDDGGTTGPVSPYFSSSEILADVNGDGRLDLIEAFWVSCQNCGVDLTEFHVSLGLPGGGFAPPDSYQASADIVQIFPTDVNSDGMADLYVVSSTFANSADAPYHVELWLGQKDGHLIRSDAAGLSADGNGSYGIAIGDLSGDGWPDLVMEAPDSNLEDPPQMSLYLSDSTGALHLSQTFVAWAGQTFIRDWNRDGSPDLELLSGTMEILYNRGDGTFEPPLDCALSVGNGGWGEQDVVVEDFNRDGWMDLALGNLDGRVDVMLGLGGCGFAPISYYDAPGNVGGNWFLRAADMNGDGILDLVSVRAVDGPDPKDPSGLATVTTDNLLAVLLGNPDGTFRSPDTAISLGPNQISDVAIGEVSGDQRPDVIVSSANGQTGQTSTWENTCQ